MTATETDDRAFQVQPFSNSDAPLSTHSLFKIPEEESTSKGPLEQWKYSEILFQI